jgi:micrococcal nuclease
MKSGRKQHSIITNYDYTLKVISITDGDTFKGLTDDNKQIKIRLYAIDAPEKKQEFGNKSKQYLSNLIVGKTVGIKKKGKSWDRVVALVYTPEGKDASAEMLKAGMAWHYKKYDHSTEYENDENIARKNKIGLWTNKNPTPPWVWRKTKSK